VKTTISPFFFLINRPVLTFNFLSVLFRLHTHFLFLFPIILPTKFLGRLFKDLRRRMIHNPDFTRQINFPGETAALSLNQPGRTLFPVIFHLVVKKAFPPSLSEARRPGRCFRLAAK
jgi:hypothetical protein